MKSISTAKPQNQGIKTIKGRKGVWKKPEDNRTMEEENRIEDKRIKSKKYR
jgi:hypothetical protein